MSWKKVHQDVGEILPEFCYTVQYFDALNNDKMAIMAGGRLVGFTEAQATMVAGILNLQIEATELALSIPLPNPTSKGQPS